MLRINDLETSLRLRRYGLARFMDVFSDTTARERLALFHIARLAPPEAMALEIGSHLGSSALFLCAGLKSNRGHLYCIDTWMNDTMDDGRQDNFDQFTANTKIFADMITPLRKRSEALSFSDVRRELDLAFIDGDHSEEAVRADFGCVSPFVRPGGIIAFHDIGDHFPGVGIVVGEALASREWRLAGYVDTLGWIRKTDSDGV